MKPKSRWEEDVLINNHTSVWGSWWREGQWGYACCHQVGPALIATGCKCTTCKPTAAVGFKNLCRVRVLPPGGEMAIKVMRSDSGLYSSARVRAGFSIHGDADWGLARMVTLIRVEALMLSVARCNGGRYSMSRVRV